MAATQESQIDTLEQGRVYVFYRPRIEEEHPTGLTDVQQLYVVLAAKEPQRHRLIVIGRKQLPDPGSSGGPPHWSFVDLVRKSPKAIADALSSATYETKTRGERHLPAARPVGQGVYRILRHDDHVHLVWFLDQPERPGEVQRALHVQSSASYVVTVRRPGAPGPRRAGLSRERAAKFPKRLEQRFRGRKFAELDPPDFLNYEGAEILFVPAADDPCRELEICIDPSGARTDVFRVLQLDRDEHPTEPLFGGTWT